MRSKLFAAVLGAAATLIVGSVAWATIPDADGVIHACLKNGVPRIVDVDAGESCKASERPLDWNQAGQPGTSGGVSGYQLLTGDAVTLGPGASGEASVTCPEGTRALGGGYIADPTVRLTSVIPAGGGTVWSAAGVNLSDMQSAVIRARVVCANVKS
jgi:hypothetical protein